jgi:excisionase family DNA binding protein
MKLLTVKMVAERMDCSASHVYNMIAGGDLQAVRIGRKAGLRIDEASYVLFIERRTDHRHERVTTQPPP